MDWAYSITTVTGTHTGQQTPQVHVKQQQQYNVVYYLESMLNTGEFIINSIWQIPRVHVKYRWVYYQQYMIDTSSACCCIFGRPSTRSNENSSLKWPMHCISTPTLMSSFVSIFHVCLMYIYRTLLLSVSVLTGLSYNLSVRTEQDFFTG